MLSEDLPDSLSLDNVIAAIRKIDKSDSEFELTPTYVIHNAKRSYGKYPFYPVNLVARYAIEENLGSELPKDKDLRLYEGSKAFRLLEAAGFNPVPRSEMRALQYGEQEVEGDQLTSFALEKNLEDFLVNEWDQISHFKDYDLYQEDGETGRQVITRTGPLDLLATTKDGSRMLVIELKRNAGEDKALGQTLRYITDIERRFKEAKVEGIIICLKQSAQLREAVIQVPKVKVLEYKITFDLLECTQG